MTDSLEGKVAVVTGAARGQGEAAARLLAVHGARVVIADVLEDEGRAVAESLDGRAAYCRLDVGEERDWDEVADLARARFGGVDIVINNAAIHQASALVETSLATYERVVRVNQIGCFLGMRMGARELRARGGGSIVNISSVNALIGVPNTIAYSATKSAMRAMSKSAAVELGPDGIRVNTIFPGAIRTPMISTDDTARMEDLVRTLPISRIAAPREVASVVLMLASNQGSYCTGAEFVVDGGLTSGMVVS